jgi:glycine/D-amino acid oxidase-like deaminating enzyme/nitrite reductase/ring-hydroxylating ferredoxin subunit
MPPPTSEGIIFLASFENPFMRRDGATISLWQTIDEFKPANTASNTKVYDAFIVGGGITGITTALLLQKAGLNCIVAEAKNLCFGTTGGTTAHLNTIMDTTYDMVESRFGADGAQLLARVTQKALDLVQQHVAQYGIDCGYESKEGYIYAQEEGQFKMLDDIYESSLKAGVAVERADHNGVPVDFQKAIVFKGQAQFHPTRYVYALADEFEKSGGVIVQNCRVHHVKEDEIHTIETEQGNFKASRLIYATHIPPGVNILHFRCAPYRSYAMAFTLFEGLPPAGLSYDLHDPYHYHRAQVVDGKQYIIVGGEDHKTAHLKNTEECFRHLESYIRKYYSVDQIAYKWSSQYFEPADGLAYIGHLPGNRENVYVATGFGGNGITYSHIAAITLTELLTTGSTQYDKLFAPGRVKPVAGFTNFVKEQADVVKEFVGGWVGSESIQGLAELAPDEAMVVKYEGKKLALYKDETGKAHAISPVCPHAKCIVEWNNAEKSWDCPCHGSRFNCDGEVLTGPARTNLEQVELRDLLKE